MGEFRVGEIAETVIQGDLNGFVGPKTIGFSDGRFQAFPIEVNDHLDAALRGRGEIRTGSVVMNKIWHRINGDASYSL